MLALKRTLFPVESRHVPGQRGLNIALRTLHLVGIAGIGGGYFYGAEDETWRLYQGLCVVSGALLALLFVYISGIWLLQLRGLVILFKLLLYSSIFLWPDLGVILMIVILILSGWIAHAPASIRYYSPIYRRPIERLPEYGD